MQGLLADVNIQGHVAYLRRLMHGLGVLEILTELGISLLTFPDVGLDPALDDRTLWNLCQQNDWLLLTDNRNREDDDSLAAVIQDSWREGLLPVLTLADKRKFETSETYAVKVAQDVAELLVVAFVDQIRDQPRIFVPL